LKGRNAVYTVKKRVDQTKQPRGGYVNPKAFEVVHIEDGVILNQEENIHASIIGTVVDYLTRYMMGSKPYKAFQVPMKGAKYAGEEEKSIELLKIVNGLDDDSVRAACQLIGYDVVVRAGMAYFRPVTEIQPDDATIENIRTMVRRSVAFWEKYGPIELDGFTLDGGYTDTISMGDGDYVTYDTLWDFKVIKSEPSSKHTLQLLIYYLMGVRSIHEEFETVSKLGIFNPRKNNVYLLDISSIPNDVIKIVSSEVIGYK